VKFWTFWKGHGKPGIWGSGKPEFWGQENRNFRVVTKNRNFGVRKTGILGVPEFPGF
jgi:hypothetical protein